MAVATPYIEECPNCHSHFTKTFAKADGAYRECLECGRQWKREVRDDRWP